MKQFEYKLIDSFSDNYSMKELGLEGWELVSAVSFSGSILYYFKREIICKE